MRVLIIGGTGPTGPPMVEEAFNRGWEVTIYHRGTHEVEFSCPVAHIHGDPFSMEELERDLSRLRFDAVISSYGRLRYTAKAMAGRCERFIGITGGRSYLGWADPDLQRGIL